MYGIWGMGINLLNICRTIQFKIFDYITLSELLQQLGFEGRNVSCLIVAMIIVEIQQILPDNMYTLEGNAFKNF